MGLSAARDTVSMGSHPIPYRLSVAVKANAVIYKGGIVAIDTTTGYAKQGVTATTLVVVGVAEESVDATGLASGALHCNVRQGVFKMVNSSGDPLAITDVGGLCYVEDDQTISKTSGGSTQSVAGTFVALDADGGVWCWLGLAPQSTSALAALAALAVQTTGVQTITGKKTITDPVIKDGLEASGAVANDFSGSTGAFKTSTGTNTLGGDVVIAGSKTFTTGTGVSLFKGKQRSDAAANTIADPGTGAAIPVTDSGVLMITTAGAETNTLADPTFVGQRLTMICSVYAVGDRVVTAAHGINQTGNTIMTFGAAQDFIELVGVTVNAALRWRVVANDGVALS